MQENHFAISFSQAINPRNHLGLNTSYNGSAEKTQNPRVGRQGRSTDLPILQCRSTGPVDWKKPESWGLSVKGFRSTGPVDRANPRVGCLSVRALRSTGPVDRSNFCACTDPSDSCCLCCFLLLSLCPHRRFPWQSSTALGTLLQLLDISFIISPPTHVTHL